MSAEDAFIRAILSDPRTAAPRLVYADWLEERGDTTSICRAEYLRVECALDALPPRDRVRRKLQDRLRQLRAVVGDDWWRQLDWAGVEYCVEFEYRCPQRWDTLLPTDDSAIRHCPQCQRNVYYCGSEQDAHRLADAGECVAIDSRRLRLPMRRVRALAETGRLLGRIDPTTPRRPTLGERGTPPAPQNSL
jgi:uncharacterized protein (TIGR02996 family)